MIKHQNKIIAHATTAQQAKELKALTATLKEQASQIQKVSDRLEHLKPTKKDLMISKIISRAACLAELTSNPKSFFNCPDLHGGPTCVPGRGFRSGEIPLLDPAGSREETTAERPLNR